MTKMGDGSLRQETNREYAIDLARAFGGAIIFSFPVLMTMEMWWLGFYMNGFRLVLFTVLMLPVLAGVSYFAGFEETTTIKDDILDTFVAYAIGFAASALMLTLFGVLKSGMAMDEIVGKISLQAIPASLGAMFTESLFSKPEGGNIEEKRKRSTKYGGQLFLMVAGAIFLSMSVAPTEEIILIAYQMTDWHAGALSVLTLLIVQGFVTAGERSGQEKVSPKQSPFWSVFIRYSVVCYAVALLVSAYILWVFGQLDKTGAEIAVKSILVLGFPAALGASASRLIL